MRCPACHQPFLVRHPSQVRCLRCGWLRRERSGDPLLREPDYDFAEYRRYAETFNLKAEWAEIDFVQWLYSTHNSRAIHN